jgi:hypothetical protein
MDCVAGNARERPALALQYSLVRHLGQFDWLGGLVRTHAMIWHPCEVVVRGLRAPAVTDRSRIPAGRRLGGRPPGVVIELVCHELLRARTT